jgi:hypothetical protein
MQSPVQTVVMQVRLGAGADARSLLFGDWRSAARGAFGAQAPLEGGILFRTGGGVALVRRLWLLLGGDYRLRRLRPACLAR